MDQGPLNYTHLPLIVLSPSSGPLTRLGTSRELQGQIEAISGALFDPPANLVEESNSNENGPKISLTIRTDGADPPPPYGQPDCKILVF